LLDQAIMDAYPDWMEDRIKKLEEHAEDARDRLARIETRLDQMPTKADMREAMNGMIKWMVGTAVGLGAAAVTVTVITFTLNHATPKQVGSPHAHHCQHQAAMVIDASRV
jgi:tetrahydromethanopterin S-methyltransferase subunit B